MDILSFFTTPRSRQFRRLSILISELQEDNIDKQFDDKLKFAYNTFFRVLVNDSIVGHICSKYMLTPDDLQNISTKLLELGMGWRRGHYIPVDAFTYKDTFYYIMDRQHLLNSKDYFEVYKYLFKFF